jgi:hypothetical protein
LKRAPPVIDVFALFQNKDFNASSLAQLERGKDTRRPAANDYNVVLARFLRHAYSNLYG